MNDIKARWQTHLHMISWVSRTRHISGFLSCPS